MLFFGELLLNIDPWWYAAVGIIVILFDILVSTEILLFLGISILFLILPRAMITDPVIMAWSVPFAFFLSYVFGEKLFRLFTRNSTVINKDVEIIGSHGEVVEIINENVSYKNFYKYKEAIKHETNIEPDSDRTLRVKLLNGKILPIQNPSDLKPGAKVIVTEFDGANASVMKQ